LTFKHALQPKSKSHDKHYQTKKYDHGVQYVVVQLIHIKSQLAYIVFTNSGFAFLVDNTVIPVIILGLANIIIAKFRNTFFAFVAIIAVHFIHAAYYIVHAVAVSATIGIWTVFVFGAANETFIFGCSTFSVLTTPTLTFILVITYVTSLFNPHHTYTSIFA
jgi:hypothetical protein